MSVGRTGELLFAQLVKDKYDVQDVSANPDYWPKDIDFILTSKRTGASRTVEVKYDTKIHNTGNLYLELTNINSKQWNGEGWWLHCEADYLAYGDAQSRIFYVVPLLELRKRVEELRPRVAHCGYESTGLLVSLNDIADITVS